jgi:hypothetical protein
MTSIGELIEAAANRRGVKFKDDGLDIRRLSDGAVHALKESVFAFRARHHIHDVAWRINAFGYASSVEDSMLVRITPPGRKIREPNILHGREAGRKLSVILEQLRGS